MTEANDYPHYGKQAPVSKKYPKITIANNSQATANNKKAASNKNTANNSQATANNSQATANNSQATVNNSQATVKNKNTAWQSTANNSQNTKPVASRIKMKLSTNKKYRQKKKSKKKL